MAYLLDTNIILAYVRRSALFAKIDTAYSLSTTTQPLLISVVSEGEIRALAEEFGWGAAKKQAMNQLLVTLTVVPLPFGNVVAKYAEISENCRRNGRALGKNDLWIAATAAATNAPLLTTDRDFDPLDPLFLTRHWIDPIV